MVTSDTTATLEFHQRSIELTDGPSIKTKKGRKVAFQVDVVRVTWYGDEDPQFATAHGHYKTGVNSGVRVGASRKYALDGSEPKWLRRLIDARA